MIFDWFEPVFLLVLLALTLGCLVGLIFLWVRALRRSRGDLPTCGRCGYAARGVSTLNCPECGADYREVGIVTPRQRGSVGPVLFVILWTVLLPLPSCVISGFLVELGPKTLTPWEWLTIAPIHSGEYQEIQLNYDQFPSRWWLQSASNVKPLSLGLMVNATQWSGSLTVDPATWDYEYYSSTQSVGAQQNLDLAAVLSWMKACGVDTTKQAVQDEAAELFQIIRAVPTQGLQNPPVTHFTIQLQLVGSYVGIPVGWFFIAQPVFWLLVWLGGMLLYFRIRRRRTAEAVASGQ